MTLGFRLPASSAARATLAAGLGALAVTTVAAGTGVPTVPARGTAVAETPPAAPVALAAWAFNEPSGAVAHDRGGAHDATISGGVRLGQVAQGPTVTSYRFTATGLVRTSALGLTPETQAVSVWFRLPRGGAAHVGRIVDTGGVVIDAGSRLRVATCPALDPCGGRTLPPLVNDGAWHQVAMSLQDSTAVWYVDGVRVATVGGTSTTRLPSTGDVRIGSGFRGNVDDVVLYGGPFTDAYAASDFRSGACPQLTAPAALDSTATTRLPRLPLHTLSRFVVDRSGHRVKLAAVNWYGAEQLDRVPAGLQCQSLDAIASRIAAAGFNVVRLPWATDTWLGADRAVPPVAVAANPQLHGRTARHVFDRVIDALAAHGLLVILDNHVTRAGWCCSGTDGNALWWQGYRPKSPPRWSRWDRDERARYFRHHQIRWLHAWTRVAGRYAAAGRHPQRAVVGADLRNEPRVDNLLGIAPTWRTNPRSPWTDWPRAATRAGNRVLRANPRLLVVVEGLNYATDLRGAAAVPIRLTRAHRLVYSAHDYAWTQSATTEAELRRQLGEWWGWLLQRHRPYTTPVWVGEFGTCQPELAGCTDAQDAWFAAFTRYLSDGDIDWAYWSINGTGGRGRAAPTTCDETPRFPGCGESYGLSDATWAGRSSPKLSSALHALQPATQGP